MYTADKPCTVVVEEMEEDAEIVVVVVVVEAVTGGLSDEGAGLWLLVEAICASTSITRSTTSSDGSDRVRSNTGNSSSRYRHI